MLLSSGSVDSFFKGRLSILSNVKFSSSSIASLSFRSPSLVFNFAISTSSVIALASVLSSESLTKHGLRQLDSDLFESEANSFFEASIASSIIDVSSISCFSIFGWSTESVFGVSVCGSLIDSASVFPANTSPAT